MIEVVIVGICVDIGQGHTVQLCIGEGVNQLRLEMLLILGNGKNGHLLSLLDIGKMEAH